jgi:hypothetical protein
LESLCLINNEREKWKLLAKKIDLAENLKIHFASLQGIGFVELIKPISAGFSRSFRAVLPQLF